MSYIAQYKSTIETHLKGKSNRILLVDKNGYQIICKIFSQEEINDMGLIGILKIEDKKILEAETIFENEIVFFVGNESNTKIIEIIKMAMSHVYIFFYNYINNEIVKELRKYSNICDVSFGSLEFYPTSEKSVVGKDIFSVMKNKPQKIIYHKSGNFLQENVFNKLDESLNKCAIFEKEENSMLYILGRTYDEITPIVTPWRYQSLINYLNIELGPPGSDSFFAKYKFSLYDKVAEEFLCQTTSLTSEKKITNDVTDQFKLENKTRIISKHVEISSNIQKHIKRKKLLEKSSLEQKALIGTANSTELKELARVNSQLYKLLMEGKSVTLKGLINTLNFFGENNERSTYHQYIPPLRKVLTDLKTTYSKYSKIYVYVNDFICYEEIAEIAEIENMSVGPEIYLLSDSLQNSQLNSVLVNDKFERSNDMFRVIKNEFKNETNLIANVYYSEIEEKINYLNKYNFSFKKEEEYVCEQIKSALPILLTKEFAKLKTVKPKNKLEKNINNIKLSKLSKLSSEFNKYDKSSRRTHEMIKSFNTSIDNSNNQLLLLDIKNNEENQLIDFENEIENRDQGISEICDKTIQLHSMFVEVNALIAKQTLMLGTIEENIINASDLLSDGNIQLEQADKHQKDANSLSNKIIAGLFGFVVLMGIGVGIKESIMN